MRIIMLSRIVLFLSILLISFQASAQNELILKGKVLDQNTQASLMFANLTIKGYAIGTATDVDGNFDLKINSQYFKDSLIISMIGYKNKSIYISDLLKQKGEVNFLLAPTSFAFAVVEVGAPIILNDIFFEFNKHTLLAISYPELKKLYDYLEKHPDYKIEIGGHTDNVGSDEYNLALSETRAGAVVAWLEEEGIHQSRMTAKGYGESMPIATNDTELGQEQNRRVVFKVIEKDFNPMQESPKTSNNEPKKEPKVEPKVEPKTEEKKEEKKELLTIGGGTPKGEEKPVEDEDPKAIFQPKKDLGIDWNAITFKNSVEKILDKKGFHGVIMMANDKEAEFQSVYGKSNLVHDISNKATNKFYIGSLAEQFTTVLTLKLVQEKKLTLLDPIGKFLPNYPNEKSRKQITIGHLLSHSSGLISETKINAALQKNGLTFEHESYIKAFAEKSLQFSPGTQYGHSALNYYLMAVIIERVTEKDFEMLLKEEIFDKANMTQTHFLDLTTLDKNLSNSYSQTKNGLKNAVLTPQSLIFGSNNMVSSLNDLQRWDAALRSNLLLNEDHMYLFLKENLTGESFMGQIDLNGIRTKKSRETGCEVYYCYSKKKSFFVVSNVTGSGAENVYKLVIAPF